MVCQSRANKLTKPRFNILSLALVGALSSLMPDEAMAQTETISRNRTSYLWRNSNLYIDYDVQVISTDPGTAAIESYYGTVGTLTNNGGTLTGEDAGFALRGNIGRVSSIVNHGKIVGGTYGLSNEGHIGTLNNSGVIRGGYAGIAAVDPSGSFDVINNEGLISGTSFGIFSVKRIGTINNAGTISGANAIQATDDSIEWINNRGLIKGIQAILIPQGANLQTLTNSGTIAGKISNLSSTPLSIIGSDENAAFGTLTGASGGIGATEIGTLTSSVSDIHFVSGNQLLNDHINANGYTVINDASNLQINNRINIIGNYQQNAATTLRLGVTDNAMAAGSNSADNGYGRLVISGNATVDAGASITLDKLNSYNFAAGQRFVVITANSATYNADTLRYTATGFNGSITGTSITDSGKEALVLTLANIDTGGDDNGGGDHGDNGGDNNTDTIEDTNLGNTASNRHASTVLDALSRYGGIDGTMLDVYNPALALNTTDTANHGGAQLSPVAITSASAKAARVTFMGAFRAAAAHIDYRRSSSSGGSGVATGESSIHPALWTRAFGGHMTQSTREDASGYHGNFRGILIGTDALANDEWRVGGVLSYATTSVANDGSNSGSSVKVNSYGVTGYAGYDGKPWYVNLLAGAARQNFKTVRTINFSGFRDSPSGNFNGMQYIASVQVGYPLDITNAVTFTPLAGLTYGMLRQNGYKEIGNSAALNIQAAASSSLKSDLGVRLEHVIATAYGDVKPAVQLNWRHEFHYSRLRSGASFAADTSGATSFTTEGVAPLKNTGVLGLGVTLARSKNLSITTNYALEVGHGYTGQTADLRLRWEY